MKLDCLPSCSRLVLVQQKRKKNLTSMQSNIKGCLLLEVAYIFNEQFAYLARAVFKF